jgi:Arc/MetJ-type ribon-helix-helix transcriptional regulator
MEKLSKPMRKTFVIDEEIEDMIDQMVGKNSYKSSQLVRTALRYYGEMAKKKGETFVAISLHKEGRGCEDI